MIDFDEHGRRGVHVRIKDVHGDTTRDVIGKTDFQAGIGMVKGHGNEITKRGFVHLHGLMVFEVEQFDIGVIIDFIGQLADAVIYLGRDDILLGFLLGA